MLSDVKKKTEEKEVELKKQEIISLRCCLCPNQNSPDKRVCPSGPLNRSVSDCEFVRVYIDRKGWIYKVVGGLARAYTGKLKKPGSCRWTKMQQMEIHATFDEAQKELNRIAKKARWHIYIESF